MKPLKNNLYIQENRAVLAGKLKLTCRKKIRIYESQYSLYFRTSQSQVKNDSTNYISKAMSLNPYYSKYLLQDLGATSCSFNHSKNRKV